MCFYCLCCVGNLYECSIELQEWRAHPNLCCIQRMVGASGNATLSKVIFVPLPHVVHQPVLWGYLDPCPWFCRCKSKQLVECLSSQGWGGLDLICTTAASPTCLNLPPDLPPLPKEAPPLWSIFPPPSPTSRTRPTKTYPIPVQIWHCWTSAYPCPGLECSWVAMLQHVCNAQESAQGTFASTQGGGWRVGLHCKSVLFTLWTS